MGHDCRTKRYKQSTELYSELAKNGIHLLHINHVKFSAWVHYASILKMKRSPFLRNAG